MNQLATPGLGSLMAGRILPGLGQLLLALAGFALVVAWVALTLIEEYKQIDLTSDAPAKSYGWVGWAGLATFAVAWLWALTTSISVSRAAQAEGEPPRTEVPPPTTKPPSDL